MSLRNGGRRPVTLASYKVSLFDEPKGEWQLLRPAPLGLGRSDPSSYMFTFGRDHETIRRLNLEGSSFAYLVGKNAIAVDETVSAWLFFETEIRT